MLDVCPTTSSALQNASDRLKCTGKLLYHCLRNEKGKLEEKCLDPSWIQRDYCAEYNSAAQRIDAEKCNVDLGICPGKTYLSNEVTSYSACVKEIAGDGAPATNEIITSMPSTLDQTTMNAGLKTDGISNHATYVAALVPIAIVVVLVACAGCILFCRRQRLKRASQLSKNTTNDDNKNSEEKASFMENESDKSGKEFKRLKREKALKALKDRLHFFDDCYEEIYPAATKSLEEHLIMRRNVMVVGRPGVGKTSLAWHVCKKISKTQIGNSYRDLVIESNTKDVEFTFEEENVTLFLLDGCLDHCIHSFSKLEEFIGKIEELPSGELNNIVHILITISDFAFQEVFKSYDTFIAKFEVIDLTAVEKATHVSKITQVLAAHNVDLGTKTDEKSSVMLENDAFGQVMKLIPKMPIGYPLAISLFARFARVGDKNAVKDFVDRNAPESFRRFFNLSDASFFEDPLDSIRTKVKALSKSSNNLDKNHYCTLIYIMLKGGRIATDGDVDQKSFNHIAATISYKEPTLYKESSLLIRKENGIIEFCHEEVNRLFFVEFGKRCTKFVITQCETESLLRYVRTEKQYPIKEYLVVNSNEMIKILLTTLNARKVDVTTHAIWNDKRVQTLYDTLGTEISNEMSTNQGDSEFDITDAENSGNPAEEETAL